MIKEWLDNNKVTKLKPIYKDIKISDNSKGRIRYIYLFSTDNNMYKIGVAQHPRKRLKGVQTGCPTKVKILFTMPTYKALKVEAQLHTIFKDNRVQGEWFKFTEDEVEDVILEIRRRTLKPKFNHDLSKFFKAS